VHWSDFSHEIASSFASLASTQTWIAPLVLAHPLRWRHERHEWRGVASVHRPGVQRRQRQELSRARWQHDVVAEGLSRSRQGSSAPSPGSSRGRQSGGRSLAASRNGENEGKPAAADATPRLVGAARHWDSFSFARGAYREAARMYPEDLIELRQGARILASMTLCAVLAVAMWFFGW
jgi:hypothetical protein